VRNRLLAALPAEELARLQPHLKPVELRTREPLFEPETPIRNVYFPETGVVSLISRLDEGDAVEVGTAGSEGMVGLSVFLADDTSSVQAIAQVPGEARCMDVDVFTQIARAPGALHRLLLRYTQAFLTQVAQTAVCNAAHLVEQRCARWLLMTHDRVERDEFPLTHEFLAFMLGVRRAGVTVTMRALQDAGVIRYTRGHVAIVDRAGLERVSCPCYRLVRAHFERLLPPEA
jgi:CRP-like cAMP-binding protein